LVAAQDGIRYLTVGESTSKDKPGKLIFTTDMHKNIRQLSVAQDKNDVTIWFRNVKEELGYTRTKVDSLAGAAISSMLLPANMSSAFAPVVTAPSEVTGDSVRQMVVSNDQRGNLMLIEQSNDIGLWRKTPFYKPSTSVPSELKSYTVTMKAKDAKGNSLSYGGVRISSSSTISIILNGQNTLLTTVPTWFDCDQSGSLDFIIPSDSLGAQAFRIEQVRSQSGKILKFAEQRYDPSFKPMTVLAEKMKQADSPDKLGSLKTQSGADLIDSGVKNDKDTMKGAHKCLGAIAQAYSTMPPSSHLATLSTASATKRVVTAAHTSVQSTGDVLMDGWLWVREKVQEVTEWVVEMAGEYRTRSRSDLDSLTVTGDVWKFACKIAGEIKEFVLDTIEKICEAATWVRYMSGEAWTVRELTISRSGRRLRWAGRSSSISLDSSSAGMIS
jgi:hypothetical protein